MNFIYPIILGALTAFFGWTGGRDWRAYPLWLKWLFRSWSRDWMIGHLCAGYAFYMGVHSYWLLLFILATGGALSTYWDELFGFDNFWFHGFIIGVAAFPIAIVTGAWTAYIVRCFVLAVWMGAWSQYFKNPHIEEAGRYFIIGVSMFSIIN